MILERPCILLHKGTSIVSKLIKWQTRGAYSHASIWIPEANKQIEAREFANVQMSFVEDWDIVDAFEVPQMTKEQWMIAIGFCKHHLGQKYDWWAIARFITRSPGVENQKWFCSELVFEALKRSGVNLLRSIPSWKVSPAMLGYSPLLVNYKK